MKKLYWYVAVLLLSSTLCLQQCTHENDDLHPGKVQFAVNLNSISSSGSRIATDLPAGSSIIVSVKKSSGDDVLTYEKISLLKVGDQFISEPITLYPGNYRLTDFFVISEDSEVLLATPKEGSDMAYLVNDPLPVSFSIKNNQTENLNIQVVDVHTSLPEKFGYVSFNVQVVRLTQFALSVFAMDENGVALTSAEALIIFNRDTVKTYNVEPKVNQFVFDADQNAVFRLVVRKEGYKTYQKSFGSFMEFQDELNGKPFTAKIERLNSAAQLKLRSYTVGGVWGFGIAFPDDRPRTLFFSVDWGDGIVEEIISEESEGYLEPGIFPRHEYDSMGEYDIVIIGDLDKIYTLSPEQITDIDLRSLPNLEVYFTQLTGFGPASIDFTGNPKIEEIRIILTSTSEFRFSQVNTNVKIVDISGTNFSTTSIDNVIEHIHLMAKLYNHHNGSFLYEYSYPDPVGPPSEENVDMLRGLKNYYNWYIYPEP